MKDTIVQGLAQAYENLVHMIADFLPRFIVMLIIILVGLAIAFLLKKILRSILHLTKLDRISEEAGASHVLRKAAMPSMSEFLSRSVFWITAAGLRLAGNQRSPDCRAAGADLAAVSASAPNFCRDCDPVYRRCWRRISFSRAVLLTAVNAGYRSPALWSGFVRFVIWILTISMALEQVGLARATVVAAFSIVFGAVMLALAIAFGLGGRDLARQTLERYRGDKSNEKEREKEEEPSPF